MTRRDQTLRAWIERENPRQNWQSCISHRRKVHRKSTNSRIRKAALEFNLLHLAQLLRQTTQLHLQTNPSDQPDQSDLFHS